MIKELFYDYLLSRTWPILLVNPLDQHSESVRTVQSRSLVVQCNELLIEIFDWRAATSSPFGPDVL